MIGTAFNRHPKKGKTPQAWLSRATLASALGLAACAAPEAAPTGAGGPSPTTGSPSSTTGDGMVDSGTDLPIYSAGNSGGAGGASPAMEAECLRLLSLGNPAPSGVVPGMKGLDALVEWFDSTTNARAEHQARPVPITQELLADQDVILLQDLDEWSVTPAEVQTVAEWVRDGGAIIALSGYDGSGGGVIQTNLLVSFSALSFSITAQDTATSLGECGYCLGTSKKMTGFDPNHPISFKVEAVGSFAGRSIQGDGEVVLSDEGVHLAVAKQVGKGRVFLFHDDWVTYVTQWTGQVEFYCETNPSCFSESPSTSYQVGQFWYNVLRYSVPSATCLTSSDPSIIER